MTRIIKDDTDIFMLSRIIEHHMTSLTLDRKAPQAPTLIPGDKSNNCSDWSDLQQKIHEV